jgi:hypothetical protein
MKADEILAGVLGTLAVFVVSFTIGYISGTRSFINDNYGKEFIVIEKTIKTDEFSYKISNGKGNYNFTTKDNLEMSATVTIGVK